MAAENRPTAASKLVVAQTRAEQAQEQATELAARVSALEASARGTSPQLAHWRDIAGSQGGEALCRRITATREHQMLKVRTRAKKPARVEPLSEHLLP